MCPRWMESGASFGKTNAGCEEGLSPLIPHLLLALCPAAGRQPPPPPSLSSRGCGSVGQAGGPNLCTELRNVGLCLGSVTRQLVMLGNAFTAPQSQCLGTVAAHPSV